MIKSIYSYSKKVAVTFLIITMGLFTVSMSVDAVRLKVINVITEIYEEFTSIIFSKSSTVTARCPLCASLYSFPCSLKIF